MLGGIFDLLDSLMSRGFGRASWDMSIFSHVCVDLWLRRRLIHIGICIWVNMRTGMPPAFKQVIWEFLLSPLGLLLRGFEFLGLRLWLEIGDPEHGRYLRIHLYRTLNRRQRGPLLIDPIISLIKLYFISYTRLPLIASFFSLLATTLPSNSFLLLRLEGVWRLDLISPSFELQVQFLAWL